MNELPPLLYRYHYHHQIIIVMGETLVD